MRQTIIRFAIIGFFASSRAFAAVAAEPAPADSIEASKDGAADAFLKAQAASAGFVGPSHVTRSVLGAYEETDICVMTARRQHFTDEWIGRCRIDHLDGTKFKKKLDAEDSCSEEKKADYRKEGYLSVICQPVPCQNYAAKKEGIEKDGGRVIGFSPIREETKWCDLYWQERS